MICAGATVTRLQLAVSSWWQLANRLSRQMIKRGWFWINAADGCKCDCDTFKDLQFWKDPLHLMQTELGFHIRWPRGGQSWTGPTSHWPCCTGWSCDHLGAISCTMVGRWMLGYEFLCLSLNISCSFSWERFWLMAVCLSSATFRSCSSFESCLGTREKE